MKLSTFQVTNYRCVDDSGSIDVDDRVTCLVGKNESGKTALLQALRRLNPLRAATFDEVEDFPRKRYAKYQRDRKAGTAAATAITVTVTLEESDHAAVRDHFGVDVLASKSLTISMDYAQKRTPVLVTREGALVAHLVSGTAISGRSAEFPTLAALLAAVAADEDPTVKALASKVQPFTVRPLGELVWEQVLQKRFPKFLYFDDYNIMKGKSPLPELADMNRVNADDGLRTLKELLDLAGTTAQDLQSDANYEHHKAGLEATGNEISAEVFEFWRQNKSLRVEFDVHRSAAQGQGAVPVFHVRIYNSRHQNTVAFDERSRGFVWFFSFLVTFNKVVQDKTPVVILLDEPGLNLHGKAQADLLRFIEQRLAPTYQVIYTTHSPFMVDADRLDRVRTVEDVEGEGTRVSKECLTVDSDTVFPLQAALGYDIAQSLFVGPNCLLVEGPSDLLYLQTMSRIAEKRGKTALDPRWVITPVGGADKLGSFIALLGASKLNLVVLADVAKKDRQRIDTLIERRLLESSRLLGVSQFRAGSGDADIEDLLESDAYLDLAREALGSSMASTSKAAALPPGPRIVKRIEAALGHRINHFAVSQVAVSRLEALVDDATVERFVKLFAATNALLKSGMTSD